VKVLLILGLRRRRRTAAAVRRRTDLRTRGRRMRMMTTTMR